MAVIGNKNPTLADIAKAVDDKGKLIGIVELLNQTNEIITDMSWVECNLATKHKTGIRTGLPESIWRRFYQGVPNSKPKRATVEETTAQLATRSAVDIDLAKISGNVAGFRLSEATAFTESMNQSMAQQIIYGSSAMYPDRFNGLSPRYSDFDSMVGQSNMIDAGGRGNDNTSIWLIVWGPQTIHGLYPAGQPAGLQHRDLGENDVLDEDGNPYRAYQDEWKWDCGICVKDWRYAVRIANIDVSNLEAETGAADLIKLMTRALHRIPQLGMGRAAFYARRSVVEALDIQTQEKSQNTVKTGNDVFGSPALMVRGVPVRTVDAMLETEQAIIPA